MPCVHTAIRNAGDDQIIPVRSDLIGGTDRRANVIIAEIPDNLTSKSQPAVRTNRDQIEVLSVKRKREREWANGNFVFVLKSIRKS